MSQATGLPPQGTGADGDRGWRAGCVWLASSARNSVHVGRTFPPGRVLMAGKAGPKEEENPHAPAARETTAWSRPFRDGRLLDSAILGLVPLGRGAAAEQRIREDQGHPGGRTTNVDGRLGYADALRAPAIQRQSVIVDAG